MRPASSSDGGRFDFSSKEVQRISVALITAVQVSPAAGQTLLDETFSELTIEEWPAAMLAMGRVAGATATVVEAMRRIPGFQPAVEEYLRRLALLAAE